MAQFMPQGAISSEFMEFHLYADWEVIEAGYKRGFRREVGG
jgi:hypothetical protein